MKTKVVHCKREKYDIYIGRGKCPQTGKVGKWGNPFSVKEYGRAGCIAKYEQYIRNNPELLNALPELVGKTLGCWCLNKPIDYVREEKFCHGEILLKLIKERNLE